MARLESAIAVRSIASFGGREASVGLKSSTVSPLIDFSVRVKGGDGNDTASSNLLGFRNFSSSQINDIRNSESKKAVSLPLVEAAAPVPVSPVAEEAAIVQPGNNQITDKSVSESVLFFPLVPVPNVREEVNKVETKTISKFVEMPLKVSGGFRYEQEKVVKIQGLQQQALARRVRARTVNLVGPQVELSVNANLGSQSQVARELTPTLIQSSVQINTEQKTDPSERKAETYQGIKKGKLGVLNRKEIDEARRMLFVGVDQEMNKSRTRELKKTLDRIKVLGEVNGELLLNNSEIQNKDYRSKVLFQTGDDQREDGGIKGIVAELRVLGEVRSEDIELSIGRNNALRRTSFRPEKLAELRELVKVYSIDEKLPAPPPIPIVETEMIQTVRKLPVSRVYSSAITVQAAELALPSDQVPSLDTAQEEVEAVIPENSVPFSSRLFDTEVHNIGAYGLFDELSERRKLILAV